LSSDEEDEPALDDPDNPEWTEEDFARARPGREVLPPEVLAAFDKARRKALASKGKKSLVSLRIDNDVLAKFKAGGPGWQTRMNEALRKAVG
jgi:uncharacterized protein (DUF4415 family)